MRTEIDRYRAGVPCWVETLQPDPTAALDFYGPLFGWEFEGPGTMPGEPPGQYFVARLDGRDVAGIGSLPAFGGPPTAVWNTYVRVDSVDEAAHRAGEAGGRVLVGPLDAPPAGRLAVVLDPTGAAISLWEAHDRQGAQVVNQPGSWMMSSLHTPDPERAKAFYGRLLGWEPDAFGSAEAPITLWRLPGYVGGEAAQPIPSDVVAVMAPAAGDSSAVPPHWGVNLRVGDADATAERAVGLGGRVFVAPHDTPGFRNAVLADPQGAVFSVSQLTTDR